VHDRFEQISGQNLAIPPVNITAVFFQQLLFVCRVETRDLIPGHGWLAMVDDVQVVIKKQDAHELAAFDDGGALARQVGAAVFGERA